LKTIRFILLILLLQPLAGCQLFYPKVHFQLINYSSDKSVVDLKVSLAEDDVFDDSIKRSTVAPDIQYTFSKAVPKGKYTIYIEADSGRAKRVQPLMLDKDKWVIIIYNYSKPMDSASVLKEYGYLEPNKLKGKANSLLVSVRNEPVKEYF
jgi:hypothetical protein